MAIVDPVSANDPGGTVHDIATIVADPYRERERDGPCHVNADSVADRD